MEGWNGTKPTMAGAFLRFPDARPGFPRDLATRVAHVGLTVKWDNGYEGKVTRPATNLRPEGGPYA